MVWFHGVAERDHELQNPTSPDKILLLGELMRLRPESRVLDLASGRGGPALLLAATFACRITGVEKSVEFFEAACARAKERGLSDRVEFVLADAREFPLERRAYDVVLCLGASFVWGGLDATLAALIPAAKSGGYAVVGEPFWRRWPLPAGIDDDGYVPLAETVARFEARGLRPVGVIASSYDDWDRYESLHWRALEEWLAEHDDADIRRRHEEAKRQYLSYGRELFGWAIFVGRKA